MSQTILYPTSIVNTPGATGDGGALPIATTGAFTVPAIGADVTISVLSTAGFTVNQNVFVGGCNFKVSSINSSANTVTLTFLSFVGDASPGALIAAGAVVNAGSGNLPAPLITAVPVTIAQGGTGQTTQANALSAILGSSVIPAANGGTGVASARVASAFTITPDATATTATTQKLMGMGATASVTPTASGTLLVIVTGMAKNSTIGDGAEVQLYHGTGGAPTNGTSAMGTAVGAVKKMVASTAAGQQGFCLCFVITGLTVGTAYWLDVALNAVTGGTASITGVDIVAVEL